MLPILHRKIEESSFNALPAVQTLLYDGWLIRMAGGGPKRANSINLLSESTLLLKRKLDHCKELFARHQIPLTFRLTEHRFSADVDSYLAHCGFEKIDESIVMTYDLSNLPASTASIYQELDPEAWFTQMMLLDQASQVRKQKHIELLKLLVLPAIYGSVQVKSNCAAIGLVVVDGDYAGMFDIQTDPGMRRSGYARLLSRCLLRQARERGAKTAYLQVLANNQAALKLYESLGFVARYRYWYRMPPGAYKPEAVHVPASPY